MNICAQFLTACRAVAKKNKAWTDRNAAVLDQGSGYYAVESSEGQIVWEGKAHCKYCARAEAITHAAR